MGKRPFLWYNGSRRDEHMMFEKQILSVLRNEVGPDSCNTVLLAGDMNNDGWNDIVVCGKNGRLALLKNGERYRRWEH